MKNARRLSVFVMAIAIGTLACACGGGDADIDSRLFGYWIESDSEGGVLLDDDGYGWGNEIARNGDLTTARLDWNNEVLTTEATGPFGKLNYANDGEWEMEIEGEIVEGTYSLSTITSSTNVEHLFLTLSLDGTTYAVKVAELD